MPLVHLSVWGYKGSSSRRRQRRRRRGGGVEEEEELEKEGAAGVWRGSRGWVGVEVPLWGTRTIIKDSTAASV